MCIYCGTTKYRKIYENHNGPIPKDEDGRTYDIHHIDGNRKNNTIENLVAVSIQDHYDIHFSQGDWAACHRLAAKMKLSPEIISCLAKQNARNQIETGTHPFVGDGSLQTKNNLIRIKEGTHNFIGNSNPSTAMIKSGTHHFLNSEFQRQVNITRINNGTHHLLGPAHNKKRMENGTHPSQTKKVCEHCNKTVDLPNFSRWHGNNCKRRS